MTVSSCKTIFQIDKYYMCIIHGAIQTGSNQSLLYVLFSWNKDPVWSTRRGGTSFLYRLIEHNQWDYCFWSSHVTVLLISGVCDGRSVQGSLSFMSNTYKLNKNIYLDTVRCVKPPDILKYQASVFVREGLWDSEWRAGTPAFWHGDAHADS